MKPILSQPVTRISGKQTGKAPAIRKLKMLYPELSEKQIAKRVDCSPANVHQVLARFLANDYTQQDLRDYQNSKADIYDAIQMRIGTSVTKDDIAKAPLVARVTSMAILEDKARVIRGMATQINVSVLLDAVSIARQLQVEKADQAMEAVRARMALDRGSE